ncbi:hypothetical protein GO988_09310 [Hymenobacter sp. HMF4947]|uniref:DUF4175 family protein n=1 Tax=Hymenobacter ginkgonis TaxID=2682976 RepID=A0A7K1TDP3_9BACT|nr:DUF4175 family protein [Hymenobacter ginkgonis]MVN76520.1 hypothetical protein [Hymenobacter ginkgonis]
MTHPVAFREETDLPTARQLLRGVGRSYLQRRVAAVLLPTLAAGLLLVLLARYWPAASPGLALACMAVVGVALWQLWPLRRLTAAAVARRLDRQFAELEDSTGLLLPSASAPNLLAQLQQQRVAARLGHLHAASGLQLPVSFKNSLWLSALLLAGAGMLAALPPRAAPVVAGVPVRFSPANPAVKPTALPPARLDRVQLVVVPPAYTRLAAFTPTGASFSCPLGAQVRWRVHASRVVAPAPVLEIGGRRVALAPVAGQPGEFATEQTLAASTLYRLRYAGQVSDDYAIEVRPDQLPTVRIQTPKAYTLIAAVGTRPEVPIRASLHDDYGLRSAELVITVAQGEGEAVKFHEVRRNLSAGLGSQPPQIEVVSLLNLPKLGLTYGDELYFYIRAVDNHGQLARSDAFLVQWQDTAAATSALDMGMGVNTAPAYFRSERQIIIDTEKLLAEKAKLTTAEFTNRCNALGFDQQSLRLRYGKFLGEEAEKGLGTTAGPPTADDALPTAEDATAPAPAHNEPSGDHDHDHAAPPARNASPTAETDALMDPYMHKHDDAETADFLEPAVKVKLHAVLDEMWAAELRLRTNQPAAARPFEYRALRLLKEVQQQTRAYVRKAGFVQPPLPEATVRLTGELKGAAAPHVQENRPAPPAQPAVRAALRWLAATQAGQPGRAADAAQLEPAGTALAQLALQKPGAYLPALRALRQLAADARAGRQPCASCLSTAQRALTDLLPAPTPTAAPAPTPDRLARRYFEALGQ